MLRLAGAACLALCGWCSGAALARRMAERCRALEQTVRLLTQLEQDIACQKKPLGAALAALRRENAYPLLRLQDCAGLQSLHPPDSMTKEERTCFAECFSGLGHQLSAAECSRLADYRRRFCRMQGEAAQQARQARQLYPRIGLAAGAMLAIAAL